MFDNDNRMNIIVFILFSITLVTVGESQINTYIINGKRTFTVDYNLGQLMKDGEPFRYISGSIHYFRLPKMYWKDRLQKMKAAGLNTVETYIEWSQHEPSPGVYDFNNDLDLLGFLDIAKELGLFIILRPGPYICAERDLGGYPSWLFTLHPNMKLRTSDPNHKFYVKKWLDYLMPQIVPLLYGNGGPIIMVQVENEYGSYFACDREYTIWLRDLLHHYVRNNAVLFTTDGAGSSYLRCGVIPGVLTTIDFGAGTNVSEAFKVLKDAGQPNGPFINSEYYTGWLTHWNEELQTVNSSEVVSTFKDMMDYGNNTSVNFYMFFGGTNFGFTAGANCGAYGFSPQLTSYDYDAPIAESGDLTSKYFQLKNVIKKYVPSTNESDHLTINAHGHRKNYGTVKMEKAISFFDLPGRNPVISSKDPMGFEDLNLRYGFILYKHLLLNENLADPSQLYVPGLRDRAIVFLDERPVGILSRFRNIFSIPLMARRGQMLSLLVENEGRVNYGNYLNDTKGILCAVLLNGQPLYNWDMPTYPFDNIKEFEALIAESPRAISSVAPPAVYTGHLNLPENETSQADTYLNLDGWGKGVAFINGFNLGRYWVTTGPQITLYVPYHILQPGQNIITIFEMEVQHPYLEVGFQDEPYLNKTIPKLGKFKTECQIRCKILTSRLSLPGQ